MSSTGLPFPDGDGGLHEPVDVPSVQPHVGDREQRACELPRPDVESAEAGTVELVRRVAGDQRPVEVEERSDAPASALRLDLCDPLTQVAHASPLVSCCDSARIASTRRTASCISAAKAARRSRSSSSPGSTRFRLAARRSPHAKSSRETDSGVLSRPLHHELTTDAEALAQERLLLDGLARVASREPVGDDLVGLEERADHAVRDQKRRGVEAGPDLGRPVLPAGRQDRRLGPHLVRERPRARKGELELQQVPQPQRLP